MDSNDLDNKSRYQAVLLFPESVGRNAKQVQIDFRGKEPVRRLLQVETLSKPRRRRQRERQKKRFKGSMSGTFFSRPLQNDQVLGILENVNNDGLFFVFSFGIEFWHNTLSLGKF